MASVTNERAPSHSGGYELAVVLLLGLAFGKPQLALAFAVPMAVWALAQSRAHVDVSVTGIAGPGGAVPGKPVGTVCFAWASRDGVVRVETRLLPGDRAAVRDAAVTIALEGLIELARPG